MLCTMIASLLPGVGCHDREEEKLPVDREKVLIVYYSWGGNTKFAAEQIQKATGGTLFELNPVKAYPSVYRACTDQAKKEIQAGFKPELVSMPKDVNQYEIIFIGSPNWWSTIAAPLTSFLSTCDLSGKTIIPFITHGGGGMANCERDIRKLCPESRVLNGRTFAGKSIQSSGNDLFKWAHGIISVKKS